MILGNVERLPRVNALVWTWAWACLDEVPVREADSENEDLVVVVMVRINCLPIGIGLVSWGTFGERTMLAVEDGECLNQLNRSSILSGCMEYFDCIYRSSMSGRNSCSNNIYPDSLSFSVQL